jgi:hypothetical protein
MVEYCSIGNVTLLYHVSSVTYGLTQHKMMVRGGGRESCA